MLSIKGREPFIRMQLWLNDTNNIEKLQTLKNERREANKRRRTHLDEGIGFKPLDSQLFNFSSNFNMNNSLNKSLIGSPGSYSTASIPNNPQPVVKKARILFTEEQKEALRIAFAMDPYPSSTTAEFLAKELNLSIRTITNWFHNHRMRLKQINSSNNNGEESNQTGLPYSIGRDSVSFDQSHFRSLLSQRLADLKLRAAASVNSNNSNGSSNSSSNNFGSSPQHRFKYSSSLFQSQSLYSNNTNSCSSPGSSSPFQEEDDIGTLDLSMSSHNQHLRHTELDKLDSAGRSSVQDDSDDGCRSGEEEEEEIDTQSDDEERKASLSLGAKRFLGSSRRKPQHVMSSSSRRKAAQPQQWVAPLNPICFGEDDYMEENYEDDHDLIEENEPKSQPDNLNGNRKQHQPPTKRSAKSEETDFDDQKTDEEIELEPTPEDSDTDQELSVSPYKKLKSSTSVMTKLAISDDSSNIIQECVQ